MSTNEGGLLPAMQIMVALHVFASGGFQLDVGDMFGTSKATVCRTVHRVANVVAGVLNRSSNSNSMPKERKGNILQWQDCPMLLSVLVVHTST